MSWFNEQLRQRREADDVSFSEAIESIAGAVMGNRLRKALNDEELAGNNVDEIVKYFRLKKIPSNSAVPPFNDPEERLEYLLKPYGIMHRTVELDEGWYKSAVSPMIGMLKESGTPVSLIPGRFTGYVCRNVLSGQTIRINKKTARLLDRDAVCFYQPLPRKALSVKDLLLFMIQQLRTADIVLYFLLMTASTLLGLLSPLFTKWLFGEVLESKSLQALTALAGFMLCYSVGQMCFNVFQSLINSRIGIKQDIAVEAAVMSRIMSLPPSFFRRWSAGELSQRSSYVQSLCSTLFNTIGMTGLTSVFSLVYIGQVFAFAPSLVVPSIVITLSTLVLSLLTSFMQIRISRERMELSTKTSGLTYAIINGIQKIKLAGAEKRMFARWAKQYAREAELNYNPPTFLKLSSTISLAVSLAGTLVLYFLAVQNEVSVSDYYAFNAAYGVVSGAFMSVTSIALTVANIKPTLEMAKPLMEAEPETVEGREIVTSLTGSIELNHVSFRYEGSAANVIDDLSLKIRSGEYLAVVGTTGCGKSTLLRLLLGFEKPQKGSIYYDRKDISRVDMESLRKKIGVVMQDGKLFAGDIYSNIVIAAPQLTLDDAWHAAEIASVADDIRAMPMGMHTMIGEGQGGISGGQRQRLMIARAVAPSPKVLMFDEATSALDNVTQKKVSEAIDSLNCTRFVIAHRLSTIRHADRIIMLDKGHIVEDGTYEELIANNGAFAELVKRQRLDIDSD